MRLRARTSSVVGAAVAAAVVGAVTGPVGPGTAATRQVVVQSTGDSRAAVAAVVAAGGRVLVDLPIVDGVAAEVPVHRLGGVARAPGVLAVTGNDAVTTAGLGRATGVDPSTVKQAFLQSTGASVLHQRGTTGTHVAGRPTRVALVDTGIDTDVATTGDLAGRVVPVLDPRAASSDTAATVPCVDFSGEDSCDDTYGHGTFMAGLIAGDGRASRGAFSGTAPSAELVSIKIAGRTGAADVTKVLAAIQWTVSFRDRYDIGVLNLSLGSNSRTDPSVDPLNRAVQRAWDAGIVVVAAAGNSGRPTGDEPWTVTKPADDPLVLTVGATDDRETPGTSDDRVPLFSSRGGPALAKPDVAASGAHVVSLRAVGSTIDRVGTPLDATYRRGSGTSMAAAVVSGAAVLLRESRPQWTPDEVKAALRSTARKTASSDVLAVGAGYPDVAAAVDARVTGAVQPRLTPGPLGSLDASRAGLVVTGAACRSTPLLTLLLGPASGPVVGECTAQGQQFDARGVTGAWSEQSWYGSQWVTGNDWTGNDWTGNDWTGNDWTGNDWTGAEWDGGTSDEQYGSESDDPASDSLLRGSLLYGSTR